MQKLVAFDFDGVVLDSIDQLRTAYLSFLSEFGYDGSNEEFQSLNGPSISEIVGILRDRYDLPQPLERLFEVYNRHLSLAYQDCHLIEGVVDTLEYFVANGIGLALVTSSKRSEVDVILEKHHLSSIFKYIITGEDVTRSKPSPEIYKLLIELAREDDFWVVEDSFNGIESAKKAGLRVIFFDRHNNGLESEVDCRVTEMAEIPWLWRALESECCIVDRASEIEINIKPNHFPKISKEQKKRIDKYWKGIDKSEYLKDEKILFVQTMFFFEGKLVIDAFWAHYRFYFYFVNHPLEINLFQPVSISGICSLDNGLVLVGTRRNVTQYIGMNEFVPSGSISLSDNEGSASRVIDQLLLELKEEVDIDSKNIVSFEFVGIVKDLKDNVLDLCYSIRLSDVEVKESSSEYEAVRWCDMDTLEASQLIPTSVGLLYLLKAKG